MMYDEERTQIHYTMYSETINLPQVNGQTFSHIQIGTSRFRTDADWWYYTMYLGRDQRSSASKLTYFLFPTFSAGVPLKRLK
jgi:hypothetical protein